MMAVSAQSTKTHVAIAAWEWPSYFDPDTKMQGITLDVADWKRPSPESAPVHAKAANLYMICTLSKHAAEKSFTDALMLDYRGYIAEATGANISSSMARARSTRRLPTVSSTASPAARSCESLQMKVVQRHLTLDDVADMKECFLTGTAAEVTPVSKIGD